MNARSVDRPTHRARGALARLAAAGMLAGILAAPMALPVAAATPSPSPSTSTTTATTGACSAARSTFQADRTLENATALGDCMATTRLTFLGKATGRVQASRVLTTPDRAALLSILSSDTSGVTAVKAKLDSETTVAAVVADIRGMVLDYRVFALGGRQVALVTGVDAVGVIAGHFDTVHAKLEMLIGAAASQGRDVTAARASLQAMDDSVAQARTDVAGLAPKLLALTPAEYDAGTAQPVLRAARSDVLAARDALRGAREDAAAVLADLGR